MREYTIVSSQFKFSLVGFDQTIENSGGFPIIRYTAPPSGSAPLIRWKQLGKLPASAMASTETINCMRGAEVLVIGDTIHFYGITDGNYFCDQDPFINLIPAF